MSADNPFHGMVSGYAHLLDAGARVSVEAASPPRSSANAETGEDVPTVLLFSPHPDDECISGGLPLRLRREAGMRIVNVPVTLGSERQRRNARWRELEHACAYLEFEVLPAVAGGLERLHPITRQEDARSWETAVTAITNILAAQSPRIVFLPHLQDGHATHAGTSLLVHDALSRQHVFQPPLIVETEYWAAMANPNLMVASNIDDVSDLVAALSLHTGEVTRNPYHLRLPAWMIDNVRRGAEIMCGHGASAPHFPFATLYRASRLRAGRPHPLQTNHVLATADDLTRWLASFAHSRE